MKGESYEPGEDSFFGTSNPFPSHRASPVQKTMKFVRTLSPGAIIVASLAALALAGCQPKAEHHGGEVHQGKTVQAATMVVEEEIISGVFEATGTVRPLYEADISAKILAKVMRVNVRPGQPVSKGQTLISLDARDMASALRMAEANRQSAGVAVGAAQTAAAMERETSTSRIAQAEAAATQARAGLAAAEARLDLALAGPRNQEREQAKLAVAQAKAQLDQAERDLERSKRLYESGAISGRQRELDQTTYDIAKAQYDLAVQAEKIAAEGTREQDIRAAREGVAQAKAAVKQADAAVQSAKAAAMQTKLREDEIRAARAQANQSSAAVDAARTNLSFAVLSAPFDGRVVSRMADPGAMASPGLPLLKIEGGGFRLEASIPEKLLAYASVGSKGQVKLDALPEETLGARVVEVIPQGQGQSRTFIVKYALPEVPGLKSGLFGRVEIARSGAPGIRVPEAATWTNEGLDYVWVVQDGKAHLRIITIGRRENGLVEILSGLKAKEVIVTTDRNSIAEGDTVEPKNR